MNVTAMVKPHKIVHTYMIDYVYNLFSYDCQSQVFRDFEEINCVSFKQNWAQLMWALGEARM